MALSMEMAPEMVSLMAMASSMEMASEMVLLMAGAMGRCKTIN